MRLSRGSFRIATLALLALTCDGSASAQLLVAAPPDVTDAVAHAELAYAMGDGLPVTWASLRVRRGPVALIAALPAGAEPEPALDAWLSALEVTASPRVLLPRGEQDCGATSFVEVAWPRSSGAAPDELRLVSPDDVMSVLAEQGLALADELPSAAGYVVWSWPALDRATTTRTLRVRGGAAPLSFLPGASFPILLSAVTRGAARYEGEVDAGELGVTFFSGAAKRSDYRAQVERWLSAPAAPLVETRSRGLLYDWSIQSDLVSVSPLVRSYTLRAAAEVPELDANACAEALVALRTTPGDSNVEACDGARDAALALAAADPQLATLQRFIVSGAQGVWSSSLSGGGEPRAPTVRAQQLDASGCPGSQEPPRVVTPVGGGHGEPLPVPRDEPVIVEETIIVEPHQTVEVDCTGSPRPEPRDEADGDVDCSSDTSSSSTTNSDSELDCSGDTSTTSEHDSYDSCSGDSSSSGSSERDETSCNDDTSSSSSDDSGCGSDSSSSSETNGYDGDTCASVAAAPDRTQKSQAGLARGKRLKGSQRLRMSFWSVAFAAVVLPLRRRKRSRAPETEPSRKSGGVRS